MFSILTRHTPILMLKLGLNIMHREVPIQLGILEAHPRSDGLMVHNRYQLHQLELQRGGGAGAGGEAEAEAEVEVGAEGDKLVSYANPKLPKVRE